MSAAVIDAAVWYVSRGIVLTPLHGKAPYIDAWNLPDNSIGTVEAVRRHFGRHPHDNIGGILALSNLVSLDADHEAAATVLEAEGIDLAALIKQHPTILGRAPRVEFKAPEGIALEKKVVRWPKPDDPAGPGKITILELRAGANQDVLPPSIHPDTRRPYRWITSPRGGFQLLPEELLQLWLNFDAFQQRARKLCPWAKPERVAPPQRKFEPYRGTSIIAAFNEAHEVAKLLETHGYVRAGKRWRSPHAKESSAPGIVLLPSGKVFAHDSDDPLGDARAHDAFDLYTMFDHGGDIRAAVRAAAKLLGMDTRR